MSKADAIEFINARIHYHDKLVNGYRKDTVKMFYPEKLEAAEAWVNGHEHASRELKDILKLLEDEPMT